MAVPIQKRFVTVDEYHRMAEDGVFPPDARVELIRGEIVEMSPIGPAHSAAVRRFIRSFSARLSPYALVDAQNPVVLREQDSEPQPDVTLLRLQDDFYSTATPAPEDTLLMVEVAESSLSYDRKVKMHLYAEAGIPETLAGRPEFRHPLRLPPAHPRRLSGRARLSAGGVGRSGGVPGRALHR